MAENQFKIVSCGKISPEYLDGAESPEEGLARFKKNLGSAFPTSSPSQIENEEDYFVLKSGVVQSVICKALRKPNYNEEDQWSLFGCQWSEGKVPYLYYIPTKKLFSQFHSVYIRNCDIAKWEFPLLAGNKPNIIELKEKRVIDVGFKVHEEQLWSIDIYLSRRSLTKVFFHNSQALSLFKYISVQKLCWIGGEDEQNVLAYYGNDPAEIEKIQEEILKYLRPSIDHLMINLPEDFEGYPAYPEIIREDLARNSRGKYSQSSEYFGDPDFEIELDLMDAVLLRYLMSLHGNNYEHLRPLKDIEGGEAFHRRNYAFSEASILFYGSRAISALKNLAKTDLDNETKISLLLLAEKISGMYEKANEKYSQQKGRDFNTVFTPPPLNLPMMDQALSAVFPKADSMTPIYQEVDRIFDDLDTETGNQVVFVDAFEQSSFIRETPWDFASWNGLHMDELKVVYFAIKSLKRLSGAHNIKSTSVQVENKFPEDSESPSIICVKSQNSNASMECRFRKDQYWKDLIGRLKQLKEASNYSYGLKARLDQLVKQAEDLYITLTDESGPEVARKSAWGSYGSLPYTLGVGLFGAVVGAVVTVFVKEPLTTWYKSRKKSDKDDDDSNPPGVAAKGREGIVSESQGADSKFQVEPAVNFDLERLNAPVSTQSNQRGSYHIPQFDKIGVARSYFEEAIPYIGVGAAIAGTALVVGTALIRAGERLAVSGPPAPPKLGAAAAAIAVGGIMVYASEAHATSQKTQLSEKTYLVPVDSELGDAPILSLRQNFPEATRTIEKVAGASQAVIEPFTQGLRSILGD